MHGMFLPERSGETGRVKSLVAEFHYIRPANCYGSLRSLSLMVL